MKKEIKDLINELKEETADYGSLGHNLYRLYHIVEQAGNGYTHVDTCITKKEASEKYMRRITEFPGSWCTIKVTTHSIGTGLGLLLKALVEGHLFAGGDDE